MMLEFGRGEESTVDALRDRLGWGENTFLAQACEQIKHIIERLFELEKFDERLVLITDWLVSLLGDIKSTLDTDLNSFMLTRDNLVFLNRMRVFTPKDLRMVLEAKKYLRRKENKWSRVASGQDSDALKEPEAVYWSNPERKNKEITGDMFLLIKRVNEEFPEVTLEEALGTMGTLEIIAPREELQVMSAEIARTAKIFNSLLLGGKINVRMLELLIETGIANEECCEAILKAFVRNETFLRFKKGFLRHAAGVDKTGQLLIYAGTMTKLENFMVIVEARFPCYFSSVIGREAYVSRLRHLLQNEELRGAVEVSWAEEEITLALIILNQYSRHILQLDEKLLEDWLLSGGSCVADEDEYGLGLNDWRQPD